MVKPTQINAPREIHRLGSGTTKGSVAGLMLALVGVTNVFAAAPLVHALRESA
jgi:putative effector of murein hydrolase